MKPGDDYRLASHVYDLVLNPFLDKVRKDIARTLAGQGVKKVVDLGCGTGRQCLFLLEQGIHAVGVDRSPAMLRKAEQDTSPEIEYRQEDLTGTSFKNDSFDAALMSLALHEHPAETIAAVLDEASRIVRPQGFMAILEHGKIDNPRAGIIHLFSFLPERAAGRNHFRNYLRFTRGQGLQGLLDTRPDIRSVEFRRYFSGALCFCLGRVDKNLRPRSSVRCSREQTFSQNRFQPLEKI